LIGSRSSNFGWPRFVGMKWSSEQTIEYRKLMVVGHLFRSENEVYDWSYDATKSATYRPAGLVDCPLLSAHL